MKKALLTLVILLFMTISSFSQVKFQCGQEVRKVLDTKTDKITEIYNKPTQTTITLFPTYISVQKDSTETKYFADSTASGTENTLAFPVKTEKEEKVLMLITVDRIFTESVLYISVIRGNRCTQYKKVTMLERELVL